MTLTLKTIKSKSGNLKYTKLLAKIIELIKTKCEINPKETMYFLGYFDWKHIFLCNGIVYFAYVETEKVELQELYQIKLLKEYPKALSDIDFKVILGKATFTPEMFLDWIDMPSSITEVIDAPYYKVIKFLNNYKKETLSTERYNFYPKWDNDSNFILNIYAYDKKTNKEMKLYIPDKWEKDNNDNWHCLAPSLMRDVAVDDLENNLSDYQKRECKKAFIEFSNIENEIFKVKNFWVIELVKQVTNPADILHEHSWHRIFAGRDEENKPKKFTNIWVYDFPNKNEEPSFFITNSPISCITKIAVLNFKSPTYHTKGIYKRGNVKYKGWELDENYIKELMEFLKSPVKEDTLLYRGYYSKYVKTNWQHLIFEYNHNSAGWGWGDNGFEIPPEKDTDRHSDVEALPFDLPMPNYLKLLNDKW